MFWDNFIRLCQKDGISPNGVAKKLSISSGSITSWKRGSVPHYNTLLKLADYFNISVDYLLANNTDASSGNPHKRVFPASLSSTEKIDATFCTLDNIISELNKRNKQQKDLTDHLGLTKNAFTDWKSGKSKSYMKYLPQIAEFLGVSVDYLLADDKKISSDNPHDSELSEHDRNAARLYRALTSAGYIREGETLTPEQVGTLKAVITLLDASFGNAKK